MDPKAHGRFLEYVERWEYFGTVAKTRLDREQWLALDLERWPLEEKDAVEACTPEERRRLKVLRLALLID